MSTYYSGGLPQGSKIVTTLEKEHYYVLPPSTTLCFPFKMRRYYNQVVVDAADTTPFESCFVPVIRCWPSREPVGISMTAAPVSSQGTINLGPNGCKWNFWVLDQADENNLQEADLYQWIYQNDTYWFMVQNLQNKQAFFFLRFTFHGNGITHVE
jgi:hypothetical protein